KAQYASRLHALPSRVLFYVFLNTRVPPFNDVRVRRAVNYAISRDAIVQRAHGGPAYSPLTCQILPPTRVGYRLYCPYTLNPSATGVWTAPDLEKARRLVAVSGTRGTSVTIWTGLDPALVQAAGSFVPLLDHLGFRAHLKRLPDHIYRPMVQNSRTRAQMGT